VQRPLTSGSRGWPAGQIACPASQVFVSLARDFVPTCLHEKGKAMSVEKVGGGRTTWRWRKL
jgi:hypothetical protein